jgi:hypothetical protein
MQLLRAMRKDHERIRLSLMILDRTQGQSTSRQMYFADLRNLLAAQKDAKEAYFYSVLKDDAKTNAVYRNGIERHSEINELLNDLADTDMSSSHWLIKMRELKDKVETHMRLEEDLVFVCVEAKTNDAERKALGEQYEHSIRLHAA